MSEEQVSGKSMNGESAAGAARGLWFTLTVDGVCELARDASQVEALVKVTAQRSEHGAAPAGAAAEIIIMDSSGSMRRGGMLQEAKRAVAAAIEALAEDTYFAVIAGSHVAEQVYPPRGLVPATARAKDEAVARLSNRAAVGGTAMGAWLTLADSLFGTVPDAIRHAVLYTDGINEHETPEDLRAALRACRDHFACDVRGVGVDWDGREVQQIADALQGQVAAITEIADLTRDLEDLMEQAQRLVVRQAFLRLTLDRRFRVSSVRQTWPTENDLTDRCVPDDGGIMDIPLLAWAEESREYLIIADTEPGTLPYDEVRVARVDVLAQRDDASPPASCASPAAVIVRRLRSDRPPTIPKSVALAADTTRLSAVELAGAEALRRGDQDAGLRDLSAAVGIACRASALDHLDRLREVVTIDEYWNVRLRSPIDPAALQRLVAGARNHRTVRTAAAPPQPSRPAAPGQRSEAGPPPADPATESESGPPAPDGTGLVRRRCPAGHETVAAEVRFCGTSGCFHEFRPDPLAADLGSAR
jgi:Mg-chelatase subunit ChlD